MRDKTYKLVCQLPAQVALKRIEGLFSQESVEYKTADRSVASVSTPFAVFSLDRRLYSRHNWVGLNPFVYVSGVDVRFESSDDGLTRVTVRINRLRSFLWVTFWIACGGLAALGAQDQVGVIVFIGVVFASWFGIVSFLGGYLIKKEISDQLNDR